jgi:uncharacterized protein YlxW (UPF0749 family)
VSATQVAGIEMPQGEPGAVLDAVNRLDRMASGFEHSAQGFRRAAGAVPSWLGFASVAFGGLASSLEQTAAQAHAAIQDARVATRRYAEELREARQRVRRLQERAQELEQQIEEAKRHAADAARREEDARARAASALLSAPFEGIGGGGAALDAAAAAFEEADAAAAERRRWEDRITELEDELQRVRREAHDERERVRQAENRAAAQVEQVLSYFPQVESASAPTRQELIEGGHVLPPGKLTSEEAETYLDAYSREHNRHFSAMDRLSLLAMLTQGERPPDMRKLKELYEEPGWVKATNEFTGLADAERALDSFANGDILAGLGSAAMAAPVGPGKLGKLDNVVRGGDDAVETAVRRAAPGPGKWVRKNESMSEYSRRYQEFNGGRPGEVYKVERGDEYADFDSYVDGVLVDSKGRHNQFFRDGRPEDWWRGRDKLIDEAERQVRVANGAPIEWRFAEKGDFYRYFREQLEDSPIRVRHVPMPD